MSLAFEQTVVKSDYSNIENILKTAWQTKTSFTNIEIKIVGQERYTMEK